MNSSACHCEFDEHLVSGFCESFLVVCPVCLGSNFEVWILHEVKIRAFIVCVKKN